VDFEKFGNPLFVDDRWQPTYIDRLKLSATTMKFVDAATRRVYDSERIKSEMGEDYNAPVDDDAWNLLQFSFSFAAEALQDSEPAKLVFTLQTPSDTDRFKWGKTTFYVVSGERYEEIEHFTMCLDETEFFRPMTTFFEAGFGIPDEQLTMPSDEWRPSEVISGNWRISKEAAQNSLSLTIEKLSAQA